MLTFRIFCKKTGIYKDGNAQNSGPQQKECNTICEIPKANKNQYQKKIISQKVYPFLHQIQKKFSVWIIRHKINEELFLFKTVDILKIKCCNQTNPISRKKDPKGTVSKAAGKSKEYHGTQLPEKKLPVSIHPEIPCRAMSAHPEGTSIMVCPLVIFC